MATTSTTFCLLLLTSLFAISTTKTVATFVNPLSVPSCIGHSSLLKCAHDIEFAVIGTGFPEIGAEIHTISLIQDSINAAKASYINVLHFLSSNHIESGISTSLQSTFQLAISELNAASKVLLGTSPLSPSELHKVRTNLRRANQNVSKCAATLNHPNAILNLSLRSLIEQSINLTVLSLKIFGQSCGKVSIHS